MEGLHIRQGTVLDPATGLQRTMDLFLADGLIVGMDLAPQGFRATSILDAAGLLVMPGLVDLSARLREPGYEYKATLESEMSAAMAGGVTSLVCPPDTDPPLDEPGLVEMLKHRARQLHQAHVYPLGALTVGLKGERITEMAELRDAGCVAFSQADQFLSDHRVLLRAMQYAATFEFPVWLQPMDASLAADGVAHDGEVATRLGLPGIPVAAEVIALHTVLVLMRETGARVHIRRVSSEAGVALIRAAKQEGLPISADVTINHVLLSDADIGYFDAHYHLVPPLRSQRDRAAIQAGLLDGTIDAICSDHSPVDDDAKLMPFGESEPGATGLELLLPLVLKWATQAQVPLAQALRVVTAHPAAILGIAAGRIAVGAPADLCLVDAGRTWLVQPQALRSQGKNTPFQGYEMTGQVRATVVSGKLVYRAA